MPPTCVFFGEKLRGQIVKGSEMGRNRKPIGCHLADGTYRADRHRDRLGSEPIADGKPVRPCGMDPTAKKLWDAVVPELVAMGAVAKIDTVMLSEMCRWYSRYREMADKPDPDYHSAVMTVMAWKSFAQVAAKFGLSPSDRAKLRTGSAAFDDDPLIRMMSD